MTEPMTPAEARTRSSDLIAMADLASEDGRDFDSFRYMTDAMTLRAYADMLDRQTVDVEAVADRIPDVFAKYAAAGTEYGEADAARDLLSAIEGGE